MLPSPFVRPGCSSSGASTPVWKCSLGNYHDDGVCQGLRGAGVLAPEDEQPGLTNGDGSIVVDANGVITVTVQWSESGNQVRSVTINSQG